MAGVYFSDEHMTPPPQRKDGGEIRGRDVMATANQ